MRRVHVRVSGRVQGVGFRYHTEAMARQLGINGWVLNSGDRAVEAEIEGSEQAVQQMLDWMAQGPPAAWVTDISSMEVAVTGEPGFEVRPST